MPMALTPLSDADILVLRTMYLRDRYVAPTVSPVAPAIALSHYNTAMKRNYYDDETLRAKAEMIIRQWGPQISGVYWSEYQTRIASQQSDSDADIGALALQQDSFFRLIRASAFEEMMLDPGFRGSIADEKARGAMFDSWKEQIARDRTFTTGRTSPSFRGVRLAVR